MMMFRSIPRPRFCRLHSLVFDITIREERVAKVCHFAKYALVVAMEYEYILRLDVAMDTTLQFRNDQFQVVLPTDVPTHSP